MYLPHVKKFNIHSGKSFKKKGFIGLLLARKKKKKKTRFRVRPPAVVPGGKGNMPPPIMAVVEGWGRKM